MLWKKWTAVALIALGITGTASAARGADGKDTGEPGAEYIYVVYECDPREGFDTTVTVHWGGQTYVGTIEGICLNESHTIQ